MDEHENLYIIDSGNQNILRVNTTTHRVDTFYEPNGDEIPTSLLFHDSNLYYTEEGTHRVVKLEIQISAN